MLVVGQAKPGDMLDVLITGALEYDLVGKPVASLAAPETRMLVTAIDLM